jgi:hypothetical protein
MKEIILVGKTGFVSKTVFSVRLVRQVFLIPGQKPESCSKQVERHREIGVLKEHFVKNRIGLYLQVVVPDAMVKKDRVRQDINAILGDKLRIIYFGKRIGIKFLDVICAFVIYPQSFEQQCFQDVRKPVAVAGRVYEEEVDASKLQENV